MNLTLAQLAPLACSAFALAAMVRLGTARNALRIRRPDRCAACGVPQNTCRCTR